MGVRLKPQCPHQRGTVHSRQMAAQPDIDVVTTADWEWNYHDYSLRVVNLPPVYATKNRRLRRSLKEMLRKLHDSTNRVGPDH